jgi:hypothetical protein
VDSCCVGKEAFSLVFIVSVYKHLPLITQVISGA